MMAFVFRRCFYLPLLISLIAECAFVDRGALADEANSALAPETLPSAEKVQALGAGWPAGMPLPIESFPDLPEAVLANLDMQTAVRLAEERNPTIRENYQRLIASQNQLGSAYATWWPTVDANLNFGWYGENAFYNYAGATSGIDQSIYGGGDSAAVLPSYLFDRSFTSSYWQGVSTLDINWKLYDPERGPQIWKNKYIVRESSSDYIISRRDNALRTQEAFVRLQASIAGIKTSQQLVDNDQFLLSLAQARKRLGVASDLDIAKQLTVLRSDQVNLVNAKQDALIDEAKLVELLNAPLQKGVSPSTPLKPLGAWSASLDATVQSALGYRKVIEKQLAIVQQNESQVQIDLAIYRPTIELVNSLYWTKGLGYTNLGPPWIIESARSDLWNAQSLLQVTFTGFDGGRARMEAEASKSRARAAAAKVNQTINSVIAEVREYFSRAQQGREAVLAASKRVRAASDSLKLQSMRFRAGYGTITDVVQSQQDLTQAVGSYISQLSDYNLALVNLSRSSGLSFAADPDLMQQVGNPLSQVNISSVFR